jgi:hypothetical protein
MARIVTYAYRYKRPPRRKKAVAVEGPAVMRARARKRSTTVRQSDEATAERPPANDDRKSGKIAACIEISRRHQSQAEPVRGGTRSDAR